MSLLRRSQAALWSSLEAILEELIVKFKPSFDEELLVYVAGILERAESHADRKSLNTSESSDEYAVLVSIRKNISKISAKFFRPLPLDSSSSRRDERSKKTAEFTRKYKDLFEADFQLNTAETIDEILPENEKLELSDFLHRLKKWKRLLEGQISSTPSSLPLITSSHSLALFASEAPDLWAGSCDPRHADVFSTDRQTNADSDCGNPSTASSSYVAATTAAAVAAQAVARTALLEGSGGDFGGGSAIVEIPGQYFPQRTSSQDSRPCPELHAKLISFDSTVKIVRRNEQLIRKIGMVGSDGKSYHFSLQWALPYWTRTEERTAQLFYLIDRILRRGILSSRNSLSVQPTGVVPIAQRLRITSEESTRVSLEDVFRLWCEKRGTSVDVASKYFHDEFLRRVEGDKTSNIDDDAEVRAEEVASLHAFTKIRETRVQAKLLLEYMHTKLDGPEQLFQFRRNFAGQLSADALIQHALCVVERNPSRTAFLERNGQVLSPDYRFEYNNHGECPLRPVAFVR
jgi:transformation/transcription domain-associated protein